MAAGGVDRCARTAYLRIRTMIVHAELEPGALVSENSLASLTGVSRTPVREAIGRLTEEGLVQVVPKVGTYVSLVDEGAVRDAQFLREAVELTSLSTLSGPMDPIAIAVLRENLAEQRGAVDDASRFFTLDEAFHRGLMAMAGHDGSWRAVARVLGHLDRVRVLGLRHLDVPSLLIEQHAEILDHLSAGRTEAAAHTLRTHLRLILTVLPSLGGRTPSAFSRRRMG